MNFYQEDLAYVHHQSFGDLARAAALELLHLLKQRKIAHARVLDLGCGSGIFAKLLTDAGHDVLGIDLSTAMLRIAKANAAAAKFRQASIFKTDIPPSDAVVSIGECLNYQFDRHQPHTLQRLFARVFKSLQQRGIFLFDIATPAYEIGETFSYGEEWAILVEKKISRNVLTRKMTIFRKQGSTFRKTQETHQAQLYQPAFIMQLLRTSGFRVRRISRYGTLRLRKGQSAFLATKPDP